MEKSINYFNNKISTNIDFINKISPLLSKSDSKISVELDKPSSFKHTIEIVLVKMFINDFFFNKNKTYLTDKKCQLLFKHLRLPRDSTCKDVIEFYMYNNTRSNFRLKKTKNNIKISYCCSAFVYPHVSNEEILDTLRYKNSSVVYTKISNSDELNEFLYNMSVKMLRVGDIDYKSAILANVEEHIKIPV